MPRNPKQPGATFWATVVIVVVLVAYPLSFGPALGLHSRSHYDGAGGRYEQLNELIGLCFYPVIYADDRGPRPLRRAIRWYLYLWVPVGGGAEFWIRPPDPLPLAYASFIRLE